MVPSSLLGSTRYLGGFLKHFVNEFFQKLVPTGHLKTLLAKTLILVNCIGIHHCIVVWYGLRKHNFVNSCFSPRNVPFRVRIRLARKRNEDEDSIHKLYTLVTHVPVATFKGKISLCDLECCFCFSQNNI